MSTITSTESFVSALQLLITNLQRALPENKYWQNYLSKFDLSRSDCPKFHLAVMAEPFLSYVFEGKKTIESRFSVNKSVPYNHVRNGDIILLKRSGGPIVGLCMVTKVWFYELNTQVWNKIRNKQAKQICADEVFWSSHKAASFATLMQINSVIAIKPIKVYKRDRRGWVVLTPSEKWLTLKGDLL